MRTKIFSAVGALGVAIVSAVSAAAPPAVAADKPGFERRTVVINCEHRAQQRPRMFTLSCADGNNSLDRITWKMWGREKAFGEGRQILNDCTPTCVAGRFHRYQVDITLSRPQASPGRPGFARFTELTVTYPDARPPHQPAVVTYQLWD